MPKTEYMDETVLALRAKCQEKQAENQSVGEDIQMGFNKISLNRTLLFGGTCSMMLPDMLKDMDDRDIKIKYPNHNRPQIIKTDLNMDATITFKLLSFPELKSAIDISEQLKKMRCDMKQIWKQNVFYDMGTTMAKGVPVAWMDLRGFCIDGSLYSMIFMFQAGEQMVLGNFHCSFSQYDMWKPIILKLFATIEMGKDGKDDHDAV